MTGFVLAIDQGTTSSRAMVFDSALNVVAVCQHEFPQYFPRSGWVEHDPEVLFLTTVEVCRTAMEEAGLSAADITSIGITNQRETTLIWDRKTSQPVCNAIVWQDRRTAGFCAGLKADGHEPLISQRTGLLLDPYFSGSKINWILDNVDGVRARAEAGELAFGTVDSWLIWRLTDGRVHATDATNASRTMLYDIRRGCWDEELLQLMDIPPSLLPEVKDCAADFGETESEFFGGPIAIHSAIGDQQAASVGQACFKPGMMKSTYGTGCFAMLATGETLVVSQNRLLSTIALQLGGKTTYALEGSIFIAGAVVQWLRDGLGIIDNANHSQLLAELADEHQQVIMVPAFTGLGAPYWNAEARGAIYGITRATGRPELARAALESVGFQTRDLLEAMQRDWKMNGEGRGQQTVLRVDGGMTASDWTMQFLANITGAPVDRPKVLETTALGAAYLAGFHSGLYPEPQTFAKNWSLEQRFEPQMSEQIREQKYAAWQDAVRRTL